MIAKYIWRLADGTIEAYYETVSQDSDGSLTGEGSPDWYETERDYGRDRLLEEAERHSPSEEDLHEISVPDGAELIGVIENVFGEEEAVQD